MHLKSYPKLVCSELHLDAAGIKMSSQQSSLFVTQQGALLRTCSSKHGNINNTRLSSITLCCNNATSCSTKAAGRLCLKASSSTAELLSPPPYCESDTLGLYQTVAQESDAPLDIWAVIKPGHVREKIAIFASEVGRTNSVGSTTHTSSSGIRDQMAGVCLNHISMSGVPRAVKAKGSWEENCNAKRRRKSGNSQNLWQDQRSLLDADQHTFKASSRRYDLIQQLGSSEAEEQKVSVGEMVAFLEQRASEQQPDSKPLLTLQRSSTTITLSRALPSEIRGEEPESVRVLDMVARLESECLKRQTEGDLSRSNSLRRTVGRVLLAAGDQCSTHSLSSPPQSAVTSSQSSTSLLEAQSPSRESTGLSSSLATVVSIPSTEVTVRVTGGGLERQSAATKAPPPPSQEVEPLPGLLFLSPTPQACPLIDSEPTLSTQTCPFTKTKPHPTHYSMTFERKTAPSLSCFTPDSSGQSDKKRNANSGREEYGELSPGMPILPVQRRVSVSQDFREMRQRLQQLLEPQLYLSVLPHHLLVKIFVLLPTQSLAALKCTCHYFKFIIENYGVRPADSLWVSDPRYRDDPCKQCKKRYGRGDVSLCRWHHKPYCQALPYGPGYWMCCYGAHRDTPGCNVGLHDNRWVPAFHSINVPIYKRTCGDE
ncbi:F-box only protein 34 [Aulostomus maculatus]